MRLLLANLVCAAGTEYFASAQDYVLFPVVEESGMDAECRLEEEVSESIKLLRRTVLSRHVPFPRLYQANMTLRARSQA